MIGTQNSENTEGKMETKCRANNAKQRLIFT